MSKTLVVGATTNPSRYAFIAANKLLSYDHQIELIGIKKGSINNHEILDIRQKPILEDIDTITLYIGPAHQAEHIPYLLSLRPKRIIFNPGTENQAFIQAANRANIEVEVACTLVMLSAGTY